jgi:alpha-beta hydrolase superfamily lysophospholipase
MKDISRVDYRVFDKPEILSLLFYPRREAAPFRSEEVNIRNLQIPVDAEATIGARFHPAGKSAPTILFFHGNGEIVADYDEIGPLYVERNMNFLPVDYRGYGSSTGKATVTSMMRDCHVLFEYLRHWLEEEGYTGPLVVMGRSLGSAPALELAVHYRDRISGLIVESGFARFLPLLRLIGVPVSEMGITEEDGCRNLEKIGIFDKPTLVIHAEYDHIIPFTEGKAIYEAGGAREKCLVTIPGADHNTIFMTGFATYMQAIMDFSRLCCSSQDGQDGPNEGPRGL